MRTRHWLTIALLVCAAETALAMQGASLDTLVAQLRQGGHVLVMRHASSPRDLPSREQARPDNPKLERQLDDAGRRAAAAMGDALRTLRIPVGTVLTSPTYRARETAALARLDSPTSVDELGDSGKSMQGVGEAEAAWLRAKVGDIPKIGNTVLVTHQPNLSRAFPDWGASVLEGETVVFRPDAKGSFTVVGRIPVDRWAQLR